MYSCDLKNKIILKKIWLTNFMEGINGQREAYQSEVTSQVRVTGTYLNEVEPCMF